MGDVVVLIDDQDNEFGVVEKLRYVFELSVHGKTQRRFGLEPRGWHAKKGMGREGEMRRQGSGEGDKRGEMIDCVMRWVK